MRGSKHKRKRIKLQCLECNSVFDDDYRKRHKQTCNQGKRVRVAHKDAPANPFVAAKRSKSQKEYCEKSQDRDQENTAGTRGEDEEENEKKGELSGMKLNKNTRRAVFCIMYKQRVATSINLLRNVINSI